MTLCLSPQSPTIRSHSPKLAFYSWSTCPSCEGTKPGAKSSRRLERSRRRKPRLRGGCCKLCGMVPSVVVAISCYSRSSCALPGKMRCPEIKLEAQQARDDLTAVEERRKENATRDFNRRLRIGSGVESRASNSGTNPWEGLLAHVAIYDHPLTRQDVFTHWFVGAHPTGEISLFGCCTEGFTCACTMYRRRAAVRQRRRCVSFHSGPPIIS